MKYLHIDLHIMMPFLTSLYFQYGVNKKHRTEIVKLN